MNDLCENVLEASVVASVLGGVVLLLLFLAKERISPAWRYALLVMVVLRLLWIFPPSATTSWENVSPSLSKDTDLLESFSEVVGVAQTNSEPTDSQPTLLEKERAPEQEFIETSATEVVAPIEPISVVTADSNTESSYSLTQILSTVWAVGCVALLSVYLLSLIRLKLLIRSSDKLAEGEEYSLLQEACAIAEIHKAPSLVVSDSIQSPAISGIFSATIILPRNISSKISNYDLKMILLHELGHQRRKDLWVNQLMLAAQVLHWFNPLAWYFAKRTRIEAERACDAWVLSKLGDSHRSGYGNALLNLIENIGQSKKMIGAVSVVESKNDLRARIKNISNCGLKQSLVSMCAVITIIAGLTSTAFTKSVVKEKIDDGDVENWFTEKWFEATSTEDERVDRANKKYYQTIFHRCEKIPELKAFIALYNPVEALEFFEFEPINKVVKVVCVAPIDDRYTATFFASVNVNDEGFYDLTAPPTFLIEDKIGKFRTIVPNGSSVGNSVKLDQNRWNEFIDNGADIETLRFINNRFELNEVKNSVVELVLTNTGVILNSKSESLKDLPHLLKQFDSSCVVEIVAGTSVPYKEVKGVLDLCAKQGLSKIKFNQSSSSAPSVINRIGKYVYSMNDETLILEVTSKAEGSLALMAKFISEGSMARLGTGKGTSLSVKPNRWLIKHRAPNEVWASDGNTTIHLYEQIKTSKSWTGKGSSSNVVPSLVTRAPLELQKALEEEKTEIINAEKKKQPVQDSAAKIELKKVSGDSLEFRQFTLKAAHDLPALTIEQIKHAIVQDDLGADQSVTVKIVGDSFEYSNQIEVSSGSEYNPDYSVAEYKKNPTGLLISGSAKTIEDSTEIQFSYSNITMTKNVIHGTKGDKSILAPDYESWRFTLSVMFDRNDPQWTILQLPRETDGSNTYCAIKLTVAVK